MNQPELEPLSAELARLLDSERLRSAPPSAMQSRILERLGGELLDMVPPDGVLEAARPLAKLGKAAGGSLLRRRIPLALALVAAGGIGGAGLHAVLSEHPRASQPSLVAPIPVLPAKSETPPPATRPAVVTNQPVPPSSERRRESMLAARRPAPSTQPAPVAPPPPAPEPAAKERQLAPDGELAAERALLEQARTALARGKPADALAVLAQHKQAFPHGRLVEEREALAILSLQANHQTVAARELAAEFRQRHPRSMLLRAIDTALATPP